MYRILYFSPVGGSNARTLFKGIRAAFGVDSTFNLVVYDQSGRSGLEPANVIEEQGFKWPLARKHLRPDMVNEFDYIAIWEGRSRCSKRKRGLQ